MIQRYLTNQLRSPSGLIGRFILGALWNRRNAVLNEAALDRLDLQAEDRLLEIGFGGGYLLERAIPVVQRGYAVGVDASLVMAAKVGARWRAAAHTGNAAVQCGSVERLPYPDGLFSKACSINSVFYWSDIRAGVLEIHRVLQEGGRAVLVHTHRADLEKRGIAGSSSGYHEGAVQVLLEEAGFKSIRAEQGQDRHRTFTCVTAIR